MSFAITTTAMAQDIEEPTPNKPINLTERVIRVGGETGFSNLAPNIGQTAGNIIRALLTLLGVVFMIYIIYAGSLWLTARGDEEKITKSKDIIRGSIIGLIIVMSAYAITAFVLDAVIKGTGFTN